MTTTSNDTRIPLTDRGRRTRAQLLTAARRVFEQRGFAATTMGSIAKTAGVAHGTVYTYFETKEDVLAAVLDQEVEGLLASLHEASGEDPVSRVEEANRRYLEAFEEQHDLLQAVAEAAQVDDRFAEILRTLRSTHVARVAAAITRLQSDGHAATDLDPVTSAAALCSMVEGFSRHWIGGHSQVELLTAAQTLTTLWCRAIGLNPPATGPPSHEPLGGSDHRQKSRQHDEPPETSQPE